MKWGGALQTGVGASVLVPCFSESTSPTNRDWGASWLIFFSAVVSVSTSTSPQAHARRSAQPPAG